MGRFESVINKAKESCENSAMSVIEHFTNVSKTIKMPKGAEKIIPDYKLTRYATPKKSLKQLEKENTRSLKLHK